jgi:hypothetical protein
MSYVLFSDVALPEQAPTAEPSPALVALLDQRQQTRAEEEARLRRKQEAIAAANAISKNFKLLNELVEKGEEINEIYKDLGETGSTHDMNLRNFMRLNEIMKDATTAVVQGVVR